MPWCYPANPVFGDGEQAEGAVWEVLREQLPDDAALLYAVRLTEGDRHQEIDLLVAWPGVGMAAIEVAGSLGQRDTGTIRSGPSTGIVAEVRDERHMLQRILDVRRSPAAQARTVHMVALPHTPVAQDWDSPHLPRDLIIDSGDLPKAAKRIRRAIEEHGNDKGSDYGHGSRPLTGAGLTSVVDLFGTQMPSQAEALQVPLDDEHRLGHLTRDQGRFLDIFEHYPRLIATGGAGSGKTWLALEVARRCARRGDRVALVCRTRGLSRYLERVVEQWEPQDRPAFVGVPEALLSAWGVEPEPESSADPAEYWNHELAQRLYSVAVHRPDVECFDALLVDEAEEFGVEWWPALVEMLREPQTGSLVAFTDNGHSDEWRRVGAPIDVAPIVLGENLRSSRQIARLTGSFAIGEVLPRGRKRAGVRFVDVPASYAPAVADAALEALVGEGWSPGAIAVLTTDAQPVAEGESAEGYQEYWDHVLEGRDVHRGGVREFQGLERPVIVLVVNGFQDEAQARELLYLGISRARSLLVVVGPGEVIERIGGERVRKRLRKAEAWSPNG
jgi:hypothetical protein